MINNTVIKLKNRRFINYPNKWNIAYGKHKPIDCEYAGLIYVKGEDIVPYIFFSKKPIGKMSKTDYEEVLDSICQDNHLFADYIAKEESVRELFGEKFESKIIIEELEVKWHE